MSVITICKGATISAEEVKRVEAEMERIASDKDAAPVFVMTVLAILHKHNEYPKTLYKGKEARTVEHQEAEAAAAKDGFGPYDHEAFSA